MDNIIKIRPAQKNDINSIIEINDDVGLDWHGVNVDSADLWQELFNYYLQPSKKKFFLVAEVDKSIAGFIIGEARVWEFGSPLCGWVFAVEVATAMRNLGIGQKLFQEICSQMKQLGVSSVHTRVDINKKKSLSFYRSQGMRAGKSVELELEI
jgi:ribosomal protein S18 acetylase RimI-like enzyme